MNRLTQRHENGEAYVLLYAAPTDNQRINKEVVDKQKMVIERLAAYEDTGLTPEEIMDGKMRTGWTPCSERLPEKKGWYLVTRMLDVGCKDVDTKFYDTENGWVMDYVETQVLAWQPLPEPWDGDKE